MSFSIRAGEYVAFVGASGSGKSTLYRLLLGFEQPDSGSVFLDGHDLASLDQSAVCSRTGVVLQDGRLSAASILKNIIGSSSLTLNDAWEAARAAGLADDIEARQVHPLPAESVLQGEELRVEGRQRFAQLFELRLRAVHLEAGERGDLEGFLEQGSDVLDVGEQG